MLHALRSMLHVLWKIPLKNKNLTLCSRCAITAIRSVLVTHIAENIEIKIPIPKVSANPLTTLVPNQ